MKNLSTFRLPLYIYIRCRKRENLNKIKLRIRVHIWKTGFLIVREPPHFARGVLYNLLMTDLKREPVP